MWVQIVNAVLGLWLMAAPWVLGYGPVAAHNDRVVGPVVATFAIIACWEATRSVGRWNAVLALWLVLAPWVLGFEPLSAIVNSTVVGLVVGALSFLGQSVEGRYGGGWSALWSDDPAHARS